MIFSCYYTHLRFLSTKKLSSMNSLTKNNCFAFLRRIPFIDREKIEQKLRENFKIDFLFTSIYTEDCDIFIETNKHDFKKLYQFYKVNCSNKFEFEQISQMNAYFIKTNFFIKLDTPFETKCPTIETIFIKSLNSTPGFYRIRTQEPNRISEIIERFNDGMNYSSFNSNFLFFPLFSFGQKSLHPEELAVHGNDYNEIMEAISMNKWNLLRITSQKQAIVLPFNHNYCQYLNFYDDINNIYCEPLIKSNEFFRYHSDTYVFKHEDVSKKQLKYDSTSLQKKSSFTLLDFYERKKNSFLSKLKSISQAKSNSVLKTPPLMIMRIPQQCIDQGLNQFISENHISNLKYRKINIPSKKYIYSNEIRLPLSNRRIPNLRSVLNIPQERIKGSITTNNMITIYTRSFDEYETICYKLNAIDPSLPCVFPSWVDSSNNFYLGVVECWLNHSILRVIHRTPIEKLHLEKYFECSNFSLLYQYSQKNHPSEYWIAYLKFDSPDDAFNCLFKNGLNDIKIDIYSIFNSINVPYPNQFRLSNIPSTVNCTDVLNWLWDVGIHSIVKTENDFVINLKSPKDIHQLQRYHFQYFPNTLNPVLFQHTTSNLRSCLPNIFNIYGFDIENFNLSELKDWLGHGYFYHVINTNLNCVTIYLASRYIPELYYTSGKLNSNGVPTYVDYSDYYIDELLFKKNFNI